MKKIGLVAAVLSIIFVLNVSAQIKPELDPLKPRVPPDMIGKAKALKPPIPATPENIAAGKELFNGKATCFTCHGNEGKGDGPGAIGTAVGPRNFTNAEFHKAKSCGEMFWVASNGSKGVFVKKDAPSNPEGSGMVPYLNGHNSDIGLQGTPTVDEAELWKIVIYERSLGGGKCE